MANESLGDLLGQLANNSARLVRDEIELAKQEVRESLKIKAGGMLAIAIGGVFGFAAFLTLCLAMVAWLATFMAPVLAALVSAVILAIVAGALAMVGLGMLKKTTLKPQRTIQTLKEGKQWLRERV